MGENSGGKNQHDFSLSGWQRRLARRCQPDTKSFGARGVAAPAPSAGAATPRAPARTSARVANCRRFGRQWEKWHPAAYGEQACACPPRAAGAPRRLRDSHGTVVLGRQGQADEEGGAMMLGTLAPDAALVPLKLELVEVETQRHATMTAGVVR